MPRWGRIAARPFDFLVRHRLLERRNAQRRERRHAGLQLPTRPGSVGVDAQVAAAAKSPACPQHGRSVVGPGHSDFHLALVESEEPEGQAAKHGLHGRESGQDRAIAHALAVLNQVGRFGNQRSDVGQRATAGPSGRIEHGNFDRTPQRVAEAVSLPGQISAVEANPLAQRDGFAQIGEALAQHSGPVGRAELFPNGLDRLARDVRAGQPFAPTLGAVIQPAAHDDRMGVGPGVSGMFDFAAQRNADVVGVQALNPHEAQFASR